MENFTAQIIKRVVLNYSCKCINIIWASHFLWDSHVQNTGLVIKYCENIMRLFPLFYHSEEPSVQSPHKIKSSSKWWRLEFPVQRFLTDLIGIRFESTAEKRIQATNLKLQNKLKQQFLLNEKRAESCCKCESTNWRECFTTPLLVD